jgi:hypothetical protein
MAQAFDGGAPCSASRDNILAEFIAEGRWTHLLYLDDDTGVRVDAILKLLDSGHPFCAVAYRKKLKADEMQHEYVVASRRWPAPDAMGFARLDRVGGGCMLIARPVVIAMAERFPRLGYMTTSGPRLGLFREKYPRIDSGQTYVSEDYAFCDRARVAGHPLHVLVDAMTSHHGHAEWVGSMAEHWPSIVERERLNPRSPGKMTAYRTTVEPLPSAR